MLDQVENGGLPANFGPKVNFKSLFSDFDLLVRRQRVKYMTGFLKK